MSEVQLTITWLKDKSKINLSLPAESTLRELKQRLFELTRVVPDKQKYLGLKLKKSGSKPNDDTTLEMFQSKNNTLVFQLMGTPDAEIVEKNRKVDLMFVIVEQEVADVEKQVMNIREEMNRSSSGTRDKQQWNKELSKCDEVLIQKMIQLDGMENLDESSQKDRKDLILRMQEIQSLIDQLKS